MAEKQNSCVSGGEAEQAEAAEVEKKLNVRATLFFDGTCNNRANTTSRLSTGTSQQPYLDNSSQDMSTAMSGDSYTNEHTNIVKLEKMLNNSQKGDFDSHFKIYTEGAGTENLDEDSSMGAGFGTGDTGLVKKTEKAINALVRQIQSGASGGETVSITLDSLGFSRGAASARHFVYLTSPGSDFDLSALLKKKGVKVSTITYRFVGLYDTVSHHGYKMSNDVADLHLSAISIASKIVHIVAADEYRYNFPLIDTTVAGGTVVELPGVHSDIGGGFRDLHDELNVKLLSLSTGSYIKMRARYEREKKWLIDEGYFKDIPTEIIDKDKSVTLNRYKIRNTFAHIPLLIMKNYAAKEDLKFREQGNLYTLTLSYINSDRVLLSFYNTVGAMGTGKWRSNKPLAQSIRYKYVAF